MLSKKIYELTINEKIIIFLKLYIKGFVLLIVFYQNLYLAFFLSFLFLLEYKEVKIKLINDRKVKFLKQFKDFLHSYLVALSSGDICEGGIKTAYNDLEKVYKDDDYIIMFLKKVMVDKEMGISTNNSFNEIKKQIDIVEISNFITAFDICYKSGGNMNLMIRNTIDVLNNKFEMQDKINDLVSEKKYEMKIISMMPFFIILILSLSAREYISQLYTNIIGYLIITVVLIINLIASRIATRMIDVKYD